MLTIRELSENEKNDATNLAFKVFLKFEAPDYSEEGIEEFKNSIYSKDFLTTHFYIGAFEGNVLVGMIATRNNNGHVAMFFVDENMQGKGIGRKLFDKICDNNDNEFITANSSPFALPIYLHLGFQETNKEQCINGIRFTPVKYSLK